MRFDLRVIAVAALSIAACAKEADTGSRGAGASDSGTGGASGAATNTGGRTGTTTGGVAGLFGGDGAPTFTGGAGTGGASSDAARDAVMRDASSDAETRDASSDGPARDASSGGDAGRTPPPYCVAPCVWQLVKNCVPELKACVKQTIVPQATRTCDLTTGWTTLEGLVSIRAVRYEVSHDGAKCFAWDNNGVVFTATWTNAAGDAIAIKPPEDIVYCGVTYADYADTRNHAVDGGFEFADGSIVPAYRLETSRPECAPWNSYGMPVLPPCETAEAGTCP